MAKDRIASKKPKDQVTRRHIEQGMQLSEQTRQFNRDDRDVTEHQKMQQQMRRSELRLAAALQIAKLGVWELDSSGATVRFDRRCCEIFGMPDHKEICMNEEVLEYIHPEDREPVRRHVLAVFRRQGKVMPETQFRVVLPDGQLRSISYELSPVVLQDHFSLADALKWLIRQMDERFGLKVELELKTQEHITSDLLKRFFLRAVQELTLNVIKHSDVEDARVVLSKENGFLTVVVSDRGKGFNPAIVDSFGEKAGFGLLSIRERANYLGGSFQIQSAVGKGSRFSLTVPLSIAEAVEIQMHDRPGIQTPAEIFSAGGGKRILFVDDHYLMRKGLIQLIKGLPDIQVVGEAANGREALALTRQLQPDVIVMDVSMPEMDGIEATRRITAEFPAVRVIGLSMFDDEHTTHAMRTAGAQDFVTKSASSAELLKAIYGFSHTKE